MATAQKKPATRKQTGGAVKKATVKKSTTVRVRTSRPASEKAPITPKAAGKPAPAPQGEKSAKAKKPKLVRDSFTIPKSEYLVLEELKQRAVKLARPVKKSELLRAGIKALAAMPDAAFLTALNNVPAIKTGRPTA